MLGGNIVVMDEGRILQTGPTPEVYHRPATTRVAEVFSDPPINFLTGTVTQEVVKLGQDIEMPFVDHMKSLSEGRHLFGVRSNHLFLSRQSEADVEIPATVELSEINGSETFIHANHGEFQLVIQEKGVRSARIGMEIALYVNPSRFFVYDESGVLVASPSPETLGAPLS
jgi:glycerol transport system ATP-binding protein